MTEPSESGSRHPIAHAFGMTSLFADFSYEMAHVLLPYWLIHLGGTAVILALLEGFSELSRIAGSVVARSGKRSNESLGQKVQAGYALSMLSTPLMAAAFLPWHLIVLKSLSWFGKGLRGPARDTLVAEWIPSAQLPSAFAKIRALDQTGGILGPMLAVLLWGQVPIRDLLWGTALPGAICIIFANRAVTLSSRPIPDPSGLSASPSSLPSLPHVPSGFRSFLLASFLIRIGLFPATLLMFQFGKTTGMPRIMGLGFVLSSVAHVLSALWLSKQTRAVSPWRLIFSGSAILILGLFVLGFEGRIMAFYFLAMILWGTAEVLVTVGSKSLIPHLVSHKDRLGAYSLWEISGAAGMILFQPAISLFWDQGKFLAGFLGAALTVVLGTLILIILHRKTSSTSQTI